MTPDVEISTALPTDATVTWDRVASIDGVLDELRPWVRMTHPRMMGSIDITSVPIGRRWFRSWILFLGVLPLDYDDLTIVELEPGRRFLERSRMFSLRVWQHERIVEPDPSGGCRVTDRLSFEPRRLVPRPAARRIVHALFRHRHRRLSAWARSSASM